MLVIYNYDTNFSISSCCASEVIAKTPGDQVIYCAGPMNYAVAVCSDIWDLATLILSAKIHR